MGYIKSAPPLFLVIIYLPFRRLRQILSHAPMVSTDGDVHRRQVLSAEPSRGGAAQSEVFLNSGSGNARMIAMTSRQTGFT